MFFEKKWGSNGAPDMHRLVEDLKNNFIFNGLGNEDILAFVKKYFYRTVEYPVNQCIISKDEPSQYLGLVTKGSLGIYCDSEYGDHTLIGIGDHRYFFGFIPGFFGDAHSITSLYSRENCKVAYFDIGDNTEQTLGEFVKEADHRIILNMFAILSLHIRNDFDRMHIISSPYVKVRYANFLLHRYGQEGGSPRFDLLFTRTELASYLGVYRTSLSRVIKEMAESGLISVDGQTVTLLDHAGLVEIVT